MSGFNRFKEWQESIVRDVVSRRIQCPNDVVNLLVSDRKVLWR